MKKRLLICTLALLAATAYSLPAYALADLRITEIWAGGLDGTEFTSDWFEVTNIGDMPATGLDGTIYYDDSSGDPTEDTPMIGIDTIAPGESVIYFASWEDGFANVGIATTAFLAMWGPDTAGGPLEDVQIGSVTGGAGLGGSDAVFIFDGNTIAANTIDSAAYSSAPALESFVSLPNGTWVENTYAVEGGWGAYAGNIGATTTLTDPPVGSPGRIGVPEPATGILVLLGALIVAMRYRLG